MGVYYLVAKGTFLFLIFPVLISNGSVKVDSELYVSSLSNVTTTQIQRTLISSNGTNMEGFFFDKISVKGKCMYLVPLCL